MERITSCISELLHIFFGLVLGLSHFCREKISFVLENQVAQTTSLHIHILIKTFFSWLKLV